MIGTNLLYNALFPPLQVLLRFGIFLHEQKVNNTRYLITWRTLRASRILSLGQRKGRQCDILVDNTTLTA